MLDINAIIELSNRASELDSGVEGLWVVNVSENPRHTFYVVDIRSVNGGGIPRSHPRSRLAGEERRHPAGPREHPFGVNDRGGDHAPGGAKNS